MIKTGMNLEWKHFRGHITILKYNLRSVSKYISDCLNLCYLLWSENYIFDVCISHQMTQEDDKSMNQVEDSILYYPEENFLGLANYSEVYKLKYKNRNKISTKIRVRHPVKGKKKKTRFAVPGNKSLSVCCNAAWHSLHMYRIL